MTKVEILNEIISADNRIEYELLCNRIKDENNGEYPNWWFEEVIMSGLMDSVPGCSSKITLD